MVDSAATRLLRHASLAALIAVAAAADLAAQSCTITFNPIENRTNPGSPSYCPGDTLRFTICGKNNTTRTPVPAGVIWDNYLKNGCFSSYTWVSAPPDRGCSTPTDACLWNFTIAASSTLCVTLDATLAASFPTSPYTCYVTSSLDFGDLNPCMESSIFQVGCSPPGSPDTRLTKVMENFTPDDRCFNSVVSEGDTIQWKIEASNIGSGDDTNVVITDDLPAGLTNFRLVEPACTNCGAGCAACYDPLVGPNGRLTVAAGTLPRSSKYTVRFTTDVPVTCAPGKWGVSNQARVTSDWLQANVPGGLRSSDSLDGDGFDPEPTCSGPIPRTGLPTATVTKTANRATAAPGDRVHYTVRFDAAASICQVTGFFSDDPPAGFLVDPASLVAPAAWGGFASGPPSGLNGSGQVQASSIALAPGAADSVEFDVVIDPAASCLQPGINTASYSLNSGSGVASAPAVSITSSIPDAIELTKDVDRATAVKDDVLTYTIRLRNVGPCPILDGTLVDNVPSGLVLDTASVTSSLLGPVVSATATQVSITNIDLTSTAPGNELVVTFQARVDGTVSGNIVNRAAASYTVPSLGAADDATVNVSGPQCPTAPPAVLDVKAARLGPDVHLEWPSTPNAATYNVFKVVNRDRTLIPVANRATSLVDPSVVAVCQDVPEGPTSRVCDDATAVSTNPPGLLYYQVRGVCSNGVEGTAHPF